MDVGNTRVSTGESPQDAAYAVKHVPPTRRPAASVTVGSAARREPGATLRAGRARAPRPVSPRFFNRELSWLDFNARVLEEALNPLHPLLERLKFLAIYSNNLDEFFMIHVPGIWERDDPETGHPKSPAELAEILLRIQAKLQPMMLTQQRCFQELMTLLTRYDIRVLRYAEIDPAERNRLAAYFENEVFPVLTPLAVDPGHPFPYIAGLSLNLAVVVHDPLTERERFALVKVPARPVLPRLVRLEGAHRYVLLEDLITAHMGRLFSGMVVRSCYPFRVTRNADLDFQEEAADDLLELIEEELQKRRFGEVTRLELPPDLPETIRQTLVEELKVAESEIYTTEGPLSVSDFFPLTRIEIPELRDPPFVAPVTPSLLGVTDLFAAIRKADVLLHHPYQSFNSVSDFLRRAADDPQVLTIKHTLYRTSGDSPILKALIDAAENGKQVACMVELKARFDEANNISWARQLEKSGVHVVYGILGLKTHCKLTLIVRREEDGLRRYVHVGTGNYNPRTAAVYTDMGLLTCVPEFGADATDLFNYLTGFARHEQYREFLVAPVTLRRRLLELVEREIQVHRPESPGRIIAKMNALVDPELINALYAASHHGVQIDLIVRGMCCLRPGVPCLSENIRVLSILGRFLEHSRVFYFRNGGAEEVYIGSADWMPRNLDRRIEVVVPVRDPEHLRYLRDDVLAVLLEDNCQAWELRPDGCYARRRPLPGEPRRSAQAQLLEHQLLS